MRVSTLLEPLDSTDFTLSASFLDAEGHVNRRDGTDGQDGRTQVDYKLMVKAFRAIAGQ